MSNEPIEVRVDRRNWLMNNVIQLATIVVLAVAAVSVAKYKLTVFEGFMENQQKVNKETAQQMLELSATVGTQSQIQAQTNKHVDKVLSSLQDSNRNLERLVAVLEERTSSTFKGN